jgi:hypothetical protein
MEVNMSTIPVDTGGVRNSAKTRIGLATIILILPLLFGTASFAYDKYSNCNDCHGDFRASPYISKKDGTDWQTDLMDGHLNFISGNDRCDVCHAGNDRSVVRTNFSDSATKPQSCVGCHGRVADESGVCTFGAPDADGEHCGSGAGLRKQHELSPNVPSNTCYLCHTDDVGATLVGENSMPFNYGLEDIALTSPCFGESQFGPTGLDNDGDGPVDAADTDCSPGTPTLAEAILGLPDLNSNGSPDIAVFVPGTNNHVHVRDGSTDALIRDIDFGADAVYAMKLVPDLNSSGAPEIGLLNEQASSQVRVQIRDSASGVSVRNLWLGAAYAPIAFQVIPDYNASGSPEIAVMGADATDAIRVQVQDADTGTTLDNVFLGNQGFGKDFVAVADTSGNSAPELGILSVLKGNDQVRMQVWDAVDATFQTNVWFGKVYQPLSLITMPDINANGSEEIVAVGVDPATQNIRVQVRDSASAATHYNIWLGAVNEAVDIALINDINGNGFPDLAVLLKAPDGTGRVRVQDGLNGTFIRNLFYTVVESPAGIAVLSDYSGNGFEELAVLGMNNGVRHVQVLDTSTGSQVNRVDFP